MKAKEGAGQWLKRTRVAAGYPKQENLALTVGVARGAVGNWETGGKPDIANVGALASALGVTPQEIIDRFGIRGRGADVASPVPTWLGQVVDQISGLQATLDALIAVGRASPESSEQLREAADLVASVATSVRRRRRRYWIRVARERLNVRTQQEALKLIGRPSTWSRRFARISRGEDDPNEAELRDMARGFRIPVEVLAGDVTTDEERLAEWQEVPLEELSAPAAADDGPRQVRKAS
jgi:transcriptional regulator with XRE-family HTH domain